MHACKNVCMYLCLYICTHACMHVELYVYTACGIFIFTCFISSRNKRIRLWLIEQVYCYWNIFLHFNLKYRRFDFTIRLNHFSSEVHDFFTTSSLKLYQEVIRTFLGQIHISLRYLDQRSPIWSLLRNQH